MNIGLPILQVIAANCSKLQCSEIVLLGGHNALLLIYEFQTEHAEAAVPVERFGNISGENISARTFLSFYLHIGNRAKGRHCYKQLLESVVLQRAIGVNGHTDESANLLLNISQLYIRENTNPFSGIWAVPFW